MSSLDDYLSDYDIDPSDYGLSDDIFDDISSYDISDYLPTSTDSYSSYPTSSSYDYSDYLDDDSNDSGDSFGSSSGSDSTNDSTDDSTPGFDWSDFPTNGDSTSGDSSSSSGSYSGDLPSDFGSYGGLGGDYSVQQTSDRCVSSVAFKTNAPKVDLAFDVIFLVLFIALAGIGAFRLLKSKQKGAAIGKWFLFPVSLFFAILYLLIDMITLILSQCVMVTSDRYQQALTAVRWFDSLSVFLLIVLILLPICLKLQQGGNLATMTLIAHGAWLALCGIFLVVSLAVFSRIQDALYRTHDSFDRNLVKSSRGVSMAYYVFLFLAGLLASANMVFSLFRKTNIRKGALLIGIPALIFSTLVLTLVLMGGFADREYGKRNRTPSYFEKSGDAQVFLTRLFYALAFVSALVIAGSHLEIDEKNRDSAQPLTPMSQPPAIPQPANQYQQPLAPTPQPTTQYQQPVSPVFQPQTQYQQPVAPAPAPAFQQQPVPGPSQVV